MVPVKPQRARADGYMSPVSYGLIIQVINEKSENRVRIINSADGNRTSLLIDKTGRGDSGDYSLALTSEEGSETAIFTINVIGTCIHKWEHACNVMMHSCTSNSS